jgi:hypothetical protein
MPPAMIEDSIIHAQMPSSRVRLVGVCFTVVESQSQLAMGITKFPAVRVRRPCQPGQGLSRL